MRSVAIILILLLSTPWPAVGALSVRYRLVFPEANLGEPLDEASLREWIGWLGERDYDVAGFYRIQSYVDVILRDTDDMRALTQAGFVVVEREVGGPLKQTTRGGGVPAGYVNPDTLEAFLLGEVADHPDITDLTVIGQTHEGRPIFAMEISNHPGVIEDKPSIQFNGLHHAREVVTPHVVMDVISYLTDEYQAGNPQVVQWVDNYKIVCVPMVNPDGSHQVHNVDNWHRKNMAPVCEWSTQGVDLNRNYAYHWGSGSQNCERGTGSSGNTCSNSYRGEEPVSEPETDAMITLAELERFVIVVSYHASGRFIDYPYACNDGNPDMSMPEHPVIHELMLDTASAIETVDGVDYDVFSPIAIGPVNGDDTSWYYAHNATYPLIIEIGQSFQPAWATGLAIVNRNRAGWLYLMDRLGQARIDLRVVDHLTGYPVQDAQVELLDYVFDTDELPRFAEPNFGRSRWLVPTGDTYSFRVSAPGYPTRTLSVPVAGSPVDVAVLLLADGETLGDGEPDGDIDVRDFATLQNCVGEASISTPCRRFDLNGDEQVTLDDYAAFYPIMLGPN